MESNGVILNMIVENIPSRSWNDVPSVMPDEWDKKMLSEIAADPDCREFVTEQEMLESLLG